MDEESLKIVGFFVTYIVGGLILGIIAARKNRSYMAWGLIGGLFCFPCLIALALLPPLCPQCGRPLTLGEWQRRECPTCGALSAQQEPDDKGYALLQRATKLEIEGRAREAEVAYQGVIEKFPGTPAAEDAQKSLQSLRQRIG